MFTKMKLAMTATAAAGLLAVAGASGASAATISGGGSFAANAGASRLVITTGAGIPLNCTTTGGTGTVSNGTFTPPAAVGTIIPTFSSCLGPSALPFTVRCNSSGTPTPDPLSTVPATLSITGNPVAGTTAGEITGISCVVRFSASCYAFITGSVKGSYTNPGGGINGRLSIVGPNTAGNQTLTVSGSTCTNVIPNGSAMYGAPVAGTPTGLTDLTYTLTTTGPTIT